LVAQAILALAEATEQEGVTLADYLRLLQLSNDLTSTLPLPITAGWMSECEPEEWNHDG
jgi:hypothetical protein